MTVIRNSIDTQLHLLAGYIEEATLSLKAKPAGNLQCNKRQHGCEFYHRTPENGARGSYIPTNQSDLVHALAQKDYDQRFLAAAQRLQKKLTVSKNNGIVVQSPLIYQPLAAVYSNLSETRKSLVTPYVLPDELFVKEWEMKEYTANPHEFLIQGIFSEKGERMRSKSEKIIADKLYSLHIPYRYECPLQMSDGKIFYPDFTMLNVPERRIVILEHFGMMQNSEYVLKTLEKINRYRLDGYIEGYDIIFTFESEDWPLNTFEVDMLLRRIML